MNKDKTSKATGIQENPLTDIPEDSNAIPEDGSVDASEQNENGGADMADETKNNNGKKGTEIYTFEKFVREHGIDKAIARGVRTKVKVKSDGSVDEAACVEAVKAFTGQTPR